MMNITRREFTQDSFVGALLLGLGFPKRSVAVATPPILNGIIRLYNDVGVVLGEVSIIVKREDTDKETILRGMTSTEGVVHTSGVCTHATVHIEGMKPIVSSVTTYKDMIFNSTNFFVGGRVNITSYTITIPKLER